MKKQVSKIFVFALIVALVFTVVACDKKDDQKETTEAVDKPEKITAMLQVIVPVEDGRDKMLEEYKNLTGIELEVINPPHQEYYEKMNLAFASGEIPDLVETFGSYMTSYALDDAFVDLDPYYSKSEVLQQITPALIDGQRINGKLYGFPIAKGGGTMTVIRKDWLNNLNLEVPSTYEELYEVMRQFSHNDPDGNGKDDTVGFISAGVLSDMYLRDFYQTATPEFDFKDGKWVDGFTQPEMKDALERLRTAYQDKVIDPEIFTNNTTSAREKFFGGKAGIWTYWAGAWVRLINNTLIENFGEDSGAIPIPAIEGSYYYNRTPTVNAITTAAENPAGVFKWFIEFMHDGADGQMLFTHGVEGVHWEEKDGVYEKLPLLTDETKKFNKTIITAYLQLTPWEDPFKPDPMEKESLEVWAESLKQVLLVPASDTFAQRGADINTLKEQIISKIMVGDMTVEEGLEQYKAESVELEIEKVLEEMNQ